MAPDKNVLPSAPLVRILAAASFAAKAHAGQKRKGAAAEPYINHKTLPKDERKAMQVKTAPHKSARAQTLKLADKISNLRALLTSPPPDWSRERKRQYFEWARAVVSGFTSSNPYLFDEFEKTYQRISEIT